MKLRWILLGVIALIVMVIISLKAGAVCNETQIQVCNENKTQCNITITRTCTNDYNQSSSIIASTILYLLFMLGCFYLFAQLVQSESNFWYFFSFLFLYLGLFMPLYAVRTILTLPDLAERTRIILNAFFSVYAPIYTFALLCFVIYLIYFLVKTALESWRKPNWEK